MTPTSRRDRPAKPALSRDEIISTAVALFRAEGLARVTMRSVAAALDTGHASLYVYVRDTADLHAQILDAELGEVRLSAGAGVWRDELIAVLRDYGRVLSSHPEIAKTVFFERPNGPNYTALGENLLMLLVAGGIGGRTAAWGVDILLQIPAATAVEHADLGAPPQAVDFSPAAYPTIASLHDELFSGSPEQRVLWTLNLIIDGLVATAEKSTS